MICDHLGLKTGTVKKAIQVGRIIIPAKTRKTLVHTNKSQRNVIDNAQTMGKACSNVLERVLAIQTGASCPITFNNQTDLQHAGVLLALPALISQGLLRYEDEFTLEKVYYPTSSIFLSSFTIPLRINFPSFIQIQSS